MDGQHREQPYNVYLLIIGVIQMNSLVDPDHAVPALGQLLLVIRTVESYVDRAKTRHTEIR